MFLGGNGQGKTNTLESVFVLSTLRSFRSASTRNVIHYDAPKAQLEGMVINKGIPIELKIVLDKKGRKVWIGKRSVRAVGDYLGKLKVIAFTPDDLAMIKGAPSLRRRFLDGSVFIFQPSHLSVLREFNTALNAYNRLLKMETGFNRGVLDSFCHTVASRGAELSCSRRDTLERIATQAEQIMSHLGGKLMRFSVTFKPGWRMGEEASSSCLYDQLCSNVSLYMSRGYTLHGPQHDDFDLLIDSKPARWFASQGQQRACALSLLLGVIGQSIEQGYDIPVILLDDISSELDSDHRKKLFELISKIGGQVLVTATEEGLISDLLKKATRRFQVNEGYIQPI